MKAGIAEHRKQKKRWMAGILAMLTAFSAIIWQPLVTKAEETIPVEEFVPAEESVPVEEPGETVPLEGIKLNKTGLVMKSGDQRSLTAQLLPEDTTEQPEIIWNSDDTEVAVVEGNGNEAIITAAEGGGGTAVITASAGDFSAECLVLVTVREPLLESIIFMQNSSGSNRYELTEGVPGSNEYTLRISENTNVLYARPQLRDDVMGTITARFMDLNTGQETAVEMPVDESTSLTNNTTGRIINAYDTEPKELVLEVTADDWTEIYQVHIVRGTYLGDFSLTDDKGEEIPYTPDFKKTVYEYAVHVPSTAEQIRINLSPAEETSTSLMVNGEPAENGSYILPLQGQDTTAVLSAGDGYQSSPYEYQLSVYVDPVCRLDVKVEPEDAVFAIYDAGHVKLTPKDGSYELVSGDEYTYTVSAEGYQTQNGAIRLIQDEERTFTLHKSSGSGLEELDAQWGGYWKNESNQNIVDAMAPAARLEAEVSWQKQYGENADYGKSVSDGILVENYICCFNGNILMYLDKDTGEIVKSVKMAAWGNSSFTKPLYAAGMIFVPLSDGKLQAFNARTLESMWIYKDNVGGNAASALRYDSGYIYAAFANGNLVCISINDEKPNSTNEEKLAVWKQYDSKGYYRTGVYTSEKYLFACSHSTTLYCLDKKTGEIVQKTSLPLEAGAASTAVSYENGRIYFATENGYLYSYTLDEDGKLDTESSTSLKLGGAVFGTPLVYNNRVYVGSASKDKYGVVQGPYYLNVVQIDETAGSLTLAYQMETEYGAKGPGTLTTAYEQQDGYVYVYFTTDSPNGMLYLLKDKAGADAPGEGSGLFYQQREVSGAGSGSVLIDQDGHMYIRYESAWLYALRPTGVYLEGVELAGGNPVLDGGREFDGQAVKHSILLDSGEDKVTLTLKANEGTTVSVDGKEGNVQEITLTDGRAEVTVILTNGQETRSYQFSIQQRSSDILLENLQVSFSPMVTVMEMEMEPAFEPERTDYKASIYGESSQAAYYIWPRLPEGSSSTIKVTVESGSSAGTELKPVPIYLGKEVLQRYTLLTSGLIPTEVAVTVTAEDGNTQKVYRITLFQNNEQPKITAGSNALITRAEKSVTVRVNASMDGYLYYLSEPKSAVTKMPTAAEIRKNGKRMAVKAGENTVTIDGFDREAAVLYLYEMSYAQRWSSGVQIDIPAYTFVPVDPSGKGDLNGDGKITNLDVSILLDAVTAGRPLSPDIADMNNDGKVTNVDVSALLDLVTKGS